MTTIARVLKAFTREQVAQHNKDGDLWIVIDSKVYDISRFQNLHPGGASVLLDSTVAGKDATEAFYGLHRHEVLLRPKYARFQIGIIDGESSIISEAVAGELSKVPYAEPTWLSEGYYSPYYDESHKKFQNALRKWVDEFLVPDGRAREVDGKYPSPEIVQAMADYNIIAMRMGRGKHLQGRKLLGGVVTPEEFDAFHELVCTQELCRVLQRGYSDALLSGCVIGLPPVLNFGRPEVRDRVVADVLSGRRLICLAVSEAFAGSDVAGIKTTAVKTPDGKHWVINGTKKWITNGMFSHYFTVACKSQKGHTVILVERQAGVETKPIPTSYSPTAGTSFVAFENVKVPVENTLGEEGGGIFVILSNFNHERWVMCAQNVQVQRGIVEECLKWANQRKAFGKPLHSQPIIRSKLAAMIARTEALQSWLENITHQMNHMSYKEQSDKLAGQIALLKMFCTRSAQETAADAVQIFGGRGITKTGMGFLIEGFHRTVTFDSILGGAEDVLGDFGVRQAIRKMPKGARL